MKPPLTDTLGVAARPAAGLTDATSSGAGGRCEWMDMAKGICIVAVVTLYTTTHVTQGLGTASWMQYWVDFARPFRMPDFFFISGLLLSRVIDRPWRIYADKKVVHYLYFFVVWSLLYFGWRIALGHAGHGAAQIGAEFVKVMTWGPFAMLWFIQMLPFYLVLTKLLRRLPWPVVLAAAALWHMLPIDTHWTQVDRAGERYVFFFGGYALAARVFSFAAWVTQHRRLAWQALAGWAVFEAAMVFSGWAVQPGMSLLLGFMGALGVIALAALLQSWPAAAWLRRCGEQSLSIYLGFFVPMSLLMGAYLFAVRDTGSNVLDAGVLAVLLAALSIVIALAAGRLLLRSPLRWWVVRPAWAHLRAVGAKPTRTGTAGASALR